MILQEFRFRRHVGVMILVVLSAQVLLSGCEPLRRKFIRKKEKAALKSETVPIFQPEAYPPSRATPEDTYQYHYDLCLVWVRELAANIEGRDSDKKIMSTYQLFLKELAMIDGLLSGPPKEISSDCLAQARQLKEELSQPAAFRNDPKALQALRSLDRKIRQNFKAVQVRDYLQKPAESVSE